MNVLQTATFKFVDIIMLLTMVLSGPFNVAAMAMQEPAPVLAADKADYAPGESAHLSGAGFAPGDYLLVALGPDGIIAEWGTVTAGESGGFASDSPVLAAEGGYEVRAYLPGGVDWSQAPVAGASFTVTAPAPTEEPAATELPTEEPVTTEAPTDEPATEEPPTEEPTVEPTSEPELIPFIQSDKEDYQPGELVTLTGGNWQGDTQVRIVVNDNVGQTWSRDVIVDVAPDGTIVDSFYLPTWFVASYMVSASGQLTGRVVTTAFTDAPGLTLTKSASPLTYTAAGEVINFSYELKNTGSTALNGPFTVTDNKVPAVTCPATATLAVGASITCTGTYMITAADMALGYAVNTASASSSTVGSNPDVRIVSFPVTCRNDSDGANDEPGQKDLTRECLAESSINPLVISWNWDIIERTGANSADGCALFDTDNDGLANYAMCVSWQGQRVMQSGYPVLYSCNDTRSDRCAGNIPVTISNGSACAVELASDDPFSAGDSYPQDAKAFCSINLADVGGASKSTLIDVCSYPSQQPNSDPSDCVLISVDRGNLQVIKSVVPNNTNTNWDISWTGPTPYSTTITGSGTTGIQAVNAGSYTISEAAGTGTDLSLYDTTWACTVDGSPSTSGSGTTISGVSVAKGSVVICTFTNTRKTGSLEIKKDVVPDNASTNWDFAISGPSSSTCSIAGDGTCGVKTVFTGSYTITETAGSGTTLGDYGTSYACTVNGSPGASGSGTTISGLTITKNDVVVCTFTNSQSPGTLTVTKVVVPASDTGKFNLLIDGVEKASNVGDGGTTGAVFVSAGSHTVSETAGTGTDLNNYVTTIAGDCDSLGNVTVGPNQSKTCTITNTRKGTIIVEKQTSPDGAAGSFTFTGDVTGTIADDGQLTVSNLAPGTYTSTETSPLPDFALTSISCDDGSSVTPSIVDLAARTATFKLDPGETVKCTFTNTQQQGTLTVIKQVITDNGGTATADQWSMHVKSGGTDVTGSPQPGSGTGTVYTLNPGSYSVSETGGPSGYTFTGFTGDCDVSGNVTVVAGQNKTCTLTNDDQAATLIVIKHVINDSGGTASSANFTLDSGGANDSPDNFSGEESPGTTVTLDAGSYNVTETGPSGYSASYSAGCSGSIANGETKTCTVTNDDQPATLIVIKHVENNNGGSVSAGDFTMTINGVTATGGNSFPGAETPGTSKIVTPGSYTVTETGPSGYTALYSTDCTGTIALGETKTCTVTNDDQAATLVVIKHVITDNGGTAVAADFTMNVTATNPSDDSFPGAEAPGTSITLDAGSYSVSESGPSGYTASYSADCSGTIAVGQTKTCTVTNDDQPGTLIVKKVVINNNGGSLDPEDFSFSVNGGTATPFEADGQNDLTIDAGTYSVTEPAVAGYSTTYNNCSNLVIPNGGSATCIITNDDQAATLIVKKVVINDNGGTKTAIDFSFSVNGGTAVAFEADGQNDLTVNAGTYTVTEPAVSGYTTTYNNCSNLVIPNGGSATCTITNDDQPATLIVKKVVVNDNGGTLKAEDFTFSVNSGAAVSFEADGQNDLTVNAGTYTVTEPAVAGYTTTYSNCSNLDIPNGGSATCTVTNDDNAPSLTLVKVVVNDNGGTALTTDFTLSATGPTPISGAGGATSDTTFKAGTYDLSETSLPGYTASDWVCVGGAQNGAQITLGLGESATCTITNDDNTPSLTLVKEVTNDNGGTAVATDFTLSASGPTPISGAGGATSDATFDAGTYNLSETSLAGYTASDWSCVGGTQNGAQITLGLGESATCTITNDDNAPSLTLKKVVVNDNGGTATAAQWTLTASGPTGFSGVGPVVSSDASFDAGTYALSESGLAGYTASAWSCVGGTQNGSNITLGLGESATCTITNDDNTPSLTLVKEVVNDNGGTALTTAFTLSATGPTPISGAGGASSDATFDAGTYALSETGPDGYAASDWVCVGGTQNGSNITLGLGESATCTITNDDLAPSLTLVKSLVNDDGGNAVASEWTLTATGPTGISGPGPSVSNGASFDAGSYDLSEIGPSGYTASDWVCVGGKQDDADTITLALGESATCTITNDDIAPTLKLVKVVTNNNGGNAVADDWVLYAIASAPQNDRNFSNAGGSGVFETVYANVAYDLSESVVAGYTAGSWSCDGGALVGSTLTLTEGQTGVTCTITNDDSAPTLTLVKQVVNDDGGDAVISDFPLFINGNAVTSGVSNILSANTLYTASETTSAGYTPSVWGGNCAPDGTITLNEGQNATCTITNDDVAPTLKLVKFVDNGDGGNAVADDWTLSASAAAPFDGRNFRNAGGSGDFETVFANHGYDLSESTVPGYTAGTWSCIGGTLVGSTITLTQGENVTCTITNNDIAPQLRIVKTVVNDDGGNAVVADFPLFIDGSPVTNSVFVPVTANAVHTASETSLTGYSASAWGGDCAADGTITLNEGDVKTCTITNDDVAPTLKLVKNVVRDDGGDAVADDWTLFAAASAPFDGRNFSNAGGLGVFETVFANAGYDLSESTVPGYTAGTWFCDGGTLVGSTVTLTEGETGVTCTITNDDSAPTLTLIKNVVNNNGGNAQPDDFNLTIGGSPALSGVPYTLDANTPYAINETVLSGYSFVEITGDAKCPAVLGGTVTLDEGENVTCTITNDDVAPTLTLIKNVINNHGGNALPDDFDLTIGGNPALSGVAYSLAANTAYAIDETLLPGYNFVSITGDPECPAVLGGTVTLDEGENVTCTITNDDQAATLIIVKHVINDHGGTAKAEDFTLDSGGTDDSPDDFPGEEAPGTTVTLDAGSFNVTETGPAGYSASFTADCSGTIANGETKICTVTNDDIQPQLVVIKHVINNNGGIATAAQFTMEVSGNNVSPANFPGAELPGTSVALDAGSYSIAETGPAGYAPSFSADCSGSIAIGETKICTITNDDISPTLTVVKVLLPGTDTGLFNLQIDGVTQAANVGDAGTTGAVAVDAGVVHTVGETAGTGTNLSDYVTYIGGDCAADGTVSLALAENKTCTITNVRRGSIVIVKNTLGGDGTFNFTSSTLGNFSLTSSGGNASTTFSGLDPANTYDVAETASVGWELNSATCDKGETISNIDLEPGETVTCTFENEKAGSIVIVKNTVGGEGTFDFTSNTLGSFNLATAGNTASATFSNLDVDLTYDVSETVPSGWDLTGAVCTGDETIDNIDLEPGETVTCTFTNIKRAVIVITKEAIPDDPQDFSFTATEDTDTSIPDFSLDDDADGTLPKTITFSDLKPGNYTVTEALLAGWDLTGMGCTSTNDNSDWSIDLGAATATVNLGPGDTVTCSFTNTKRGHILVDKVTDPAGDPQSFSFDAQGGSNPVYVDFSLTDTDIPNDQELRPGSYAVTETLPDGWDLESVTCTSSIGDTETAGAIELDPGESVACTFVNEKDAFILVDKVTDPAGDPQEFGFTATYDADGFSLTDAATPNNSGDLDPGTYSVSETSLVGWDLTGVSCTSSNDDSETADHISLQAGETVTCTFTNTKRGAIIVEKQTDPGGLTGDFEFTGDASGTISDGGQIIVSNLVPGTYSSTESVPAGWQLTGIACNDTNSTVDLATATATFHLDPGETVKCTFTNDPLPTIAVEKSADPTSIDEPGGEVTFTVSVDNTSPEPVTLTSLVDDVYGDLLDDANNDAISNSTCADNTAIPAGGTYTCSFQAAVSGDANTTHTDTVAGIASDAEGNDATDSGSATVTVTDVLPTITVTKTPDPVSVPETGGNVTFTFKVTNTSVEPVTITSLSDSDFGTLAGDADCQVGTVLPVGGSCEFTETYFISGDYESGVSHNNTFTALAEDNEGNQASDANDATVTFTDSTAGIDVEKFVSVDNGATWQDADTATGPYVLVGQSVQFKFVVTNTGNTTLSNLSLSDTDFDLSSCTVPATLAAGASFDCTITTTALVGQHTDTATATGSFTDGAGNLESASDTDDANYFGADPQLSLAKSANPTIYTYPGQVIVYTYVLKNTGNVPLNGPFVVTDDKLGTITCQSTALPALAPGATLTCTKNYTIQASDVATDGTLVTSLPNALPVKATYGMWMQGSKSIMNITLGGLAADAGMPNGVYAGWCIQDHVAGELKNQNARLYSSIGSGLPADAANLPWNKINYVLNHKIRAAGKTNLAFYQDVQTAIWLLLGEQNPDWGITPQAQQMVNAANANPNYVPGNADVIAVLVYSDGMGTANPNISKQETIIEVTMGSITNTATATARYDGTTVTSNQAQATINQVASTGQITPTNTSCQMFRDGTSADLTEEYYLALRNKIISVAPGVFFYYSSITAPSSNFTIQVRQSNNSALNWGPIKIQDLKQVIVWKPDCTKLMTTTATYSASNGTVTINVSGATPGATYYVGIKYNPGSLVGKLAIGKPTVQYTFVSYLNNAQIIPSWDGLTFKPK